jgi:hypothetical protein
MANDKWTLFKNYLHNELGVTKDDIRVWLEEAIQEEARKMIHNTFKEYSIKQIVTDIVKEVVMDRNIFTSGFKREVTQEVSKRIAEKLIIQVGDNANEH